MFGMDFLCHLCACMMTRLILVLWLFFESCSPSKKLSLPIRDKDAAGGNKFFHMIGPLKWHLRDSLILNEILSGNVPGFLKKLVPVKVSLRVNNKIIRATYFVTPDYLSVGNNNDFSRVPMTPMAAQQIADSLHCFLPTRKMVDDIYSAATIKLEPVPLFAFRDSALVFWHHNLIIEGQRKGRKGLIAGIKKDVVISPKLTKEVRTDREAIYGWHKLDGKPIQPLYTGHVNWWVDYSHGIRLGYRTIMIEGKPMDYIDVLKDPVLRKLLCDEEDCDFYRYSY